MTNLIRAAVAVIALAWPALASAQTTVGIGTTIVFPDVAQTASYATEVTLYNPNAEELVASVAFYGAVNSPGGSGPKTCTNVSVPAGRSLQFSLGAVCALPAGNNFGLMVVKDSAVPASRPFYGYTRVQNPQGIGFSIEGFPIDNFNYKTGHSAGLKRLAATPSAPAYQTNCFVGSLESSVHYELRLFNDTTGTQVGGVVSGIIGPYSLYRFLDVFGTNGVHAPDGDYYNIRAQFAELDGGTAKMIGFCTVQDNTSFAADFRIAKNPG
jgi:hypothetical protein